MLLVTSPDTGLPLASKSGIPAAGVPKNQSLDIPNIVANEGRSPGCADGICS